MNEDIEGSKRAGHFTIAPGKEISGEITFAGEKTTLYLHDKEFFSTHSLPDQAITGVFLDLRKVSLIDCITTSGPGSGGRGNESYKFAHVFPHYILLGDHHIGPKEKKVTEISFTVNDATALFYDFDAFGLVIDAKPYIGQIANANAKIHGRKVEIGDDPQIIYFSGKREIFSADTVLGKVAASHNPSHGMGGPGGISLTNTIFINITFQEPVEFETAITRFHILRQYLELLLGRPQKVSKLGVAITPASEKLPYLSVYKTMDSDRGDSDEDDNRRPHPKDILLGTIDGLRQFATVLTNWLARHQDWRSARGRFALGFSNLRHYDIDRLVGAANMFDILPESAAPSDVQLSTEVIAAKEASRNIFRALPKTLEREGILNALGRIGKRNLKQKIRHRSKLITDIAADKFPELDLMTDEAVNCRNFYVHGNSKPSFDYDEHTEALSLFTDTLEFVFGISDMIEAGWDFKAWLTTPTGMSHPFGGYKVSYKQGLSTLKALIGKS